MEIDNALEIVKKSLDRRKFLKATGIAGMGMAATTPIAGSGTTMAAQGLAPTASGSVQYPITKDTPRRSSQLP